jgi:hypothetical protein
VENNLPPFDQYYWYPGPWRGHIREYVKSDLAMLSDYLDLEVLELEVATICLRNCLVRFDQLTVS